MEERIAALETQVAALSATLKTITEQLLPKVVQKTVAMNNTIAAMQLEASKPRRRRAAKTAEPAAVPSEDASEDD